MTEKIRRPRIVATKDDPTTLNTYQLVVHQISRSKGWYDTERSFGDFIALIHTEISEALEAYRDGGVGNAFVIEEGKPEGWAVELIDAIIRILDLLEYHDIKAERILQKKIEYNKTRSYRHGGKLL